jgi:hypothetical protein
MSVKKIECTTIAIKDGTATVYHLPYVGNSVYAPNCFWHNDKGPALVTTTGHASWWLDDDAMDFEEWCEKVTISDEEMFILRIAYL